MIRRESGTLKNTRRNVATIRGGMRADAKTAPDKSGSIWEAQSPSDFIQRLARNYTLDVGDATSRIAQDTSGDVLRGLGFNPSGYFGGKGKSSLLDYKLTDSPIGYHPGFIGANYLLGNFFNNPDFDQALAPGDAFGTARLGKSALTALKYGAKYALPPLTRAASNRASKVAVPLAAAASTVGFNNPDTATASVATGAAKLTGKLARHEADRLAGLTRGFKIEYPEVQRALFDYLASAERGATAAGERFAARFDIAPHGQSIIDRVAALSRGEDPVRWAKTLTDREVRLVGKPLGLGKRELIEVGKMIPATTEDLSRGVLGYAGIADDLVSTLKFPKGAVDRPVVQHLTSLFRGGLPITENRATGGNLGNFVMGTMSPDEALKFLIRAGKNYGLKRSEAQDYAEGLLSSFRHMM